MIRFQKSKFRVNVLGETVGSCRLESSRNLKFCIAEKCYLMYFDLLCVAIIWLLFVPVHFSKKVVVRTTIFTVNVVYPFKFQDPKLMGFYNEL